ncbi:MAG: hypothetical protein WC371_04780 [Parachlamydiales bacterium]|jgi:hypothetical protein
MWKKTVVFCFLSLFGCQLLLAQNSVIEAQIDAETASVAVDLEKKEIASEKTEEEIQEIELKAEPVLEKPVVVEKKSDLQNKMEEKTLPSIVINFFKTPKKPVARQPLKTEASLPSAEACDPSVLKSQEPLRTSLSQTLSSKPSDAKSINNCFSYFETGIGPLPLFLPSFGIGFRNQVDNQGFDYSLRVATVVFVTQVSADFLYHYYPRPNLASQFYFGAGLGGSALFGEYGDEAAFLFGPEFVLGRQFKTETQDLRFFQMKISFPNIANYSHHKNEHYKVVYFPLTVFSYGFGF